MNIDRIRLQQAVAVARGVGLTKPGDLPEGYADALANDDYDAEEVAFRMNADRKWEAALMKMGGV